MTRPTKKLTTLERVRAWSSGDIDLDIAIARAHARKLLGRHRELAPHLPPSTPVIHARKTTRAGR